MNQNKMDELKTLIVGALQKSAEFEDVQDIGPNEIGVSTNTAEVVLVIESV